jgi:biopolymer transport protein ExbD
MSKLFLIVSICVGLFSCQTSDKEEAAYWKAKYQVLKNYVDQAGLGTSAEEVVSKVSDHNTFRVGNKTFSLNGKEFQFSEMTQKVQGLSFRGEKTVNIVVASSAPYESVLQLLDCLNRHQITRFNLISEQQP